MHIFNSFESVHHSWQLMDPVTLSDAYNKSITDYNFLCVCVCFFHQLTPLHRAARRGRKNVVEYLVSKEADIGDKDNDQVLV